MLTDQVIEDGSLRATAEGFQFGLRLPWYRALPVACVEGLDVALDGQPASPEAVTVEIDDEIYTLSDLPRWHDRAWDVTDAATVTVTMPELADAAQHELDVTIAVRIPYIVESGVPLVMRERCVKSLAMDGGAS